MVTFLARSALCIGLVAAAAGGVGPGRLAATGGRDMRAIGAEAGQACLTSRGCLRIGAAVAGGSSAIWLSRRRAGAPGEASVGRLPSAGK